MAQYSAFEIIGPSMVGPSSSHTAGAVRIGLTARAILGSSLASAHIELHGSFASTGKGHATDLALVAGLLGWRPDDDRLKHSREEAKNLGVAVTFAEVDLGEDFHPNSVRVTLNSISGRRCVVLGSSIGGGSIEIVGIDGFKVRFDGSLNLRIFWHQDKAGFLANVTSVLAAADVNIASIHTTRKQRQRDALTLVETDTDNTISPECENRLSEIEGVEKLVAIPKLVD